MSERCQQCGEVPNPDGQCACPKAAPAGSGLLPCPFCGGEAESDTMQGFRRMSDGQISNAVSIHCTKCSASLVACHEDHPEYFPSDILTILAEAWNIRTQTPPKPGLT